MAHGVIKRRSYTFTVDSVPTDESYLPCLVGVSSVCDFVRQCIHCSRSLQQNISKMFGATLNSQTRKLALAK